MQKEIQNSKSKVWTFSFVLAGMLLACVLSLLNIITVQRRQLQESRQPLGALANLADSANAPRLAASLRQIQVATPSGAGRVNFPATPARTTFKNEWSAVESLRVIATAESTFQARTGWYADDLCVLAADGLLRYPLCGRMRVMDGYVFTYWRPESRTAFNVTADPIQPGETGTNHYFIDQTGVMRFQENAPATGNSPPLAR